MQDDQLMTVLLGYIDCCITSKNIMPTFYYAVIMINALTQAPNHTENIGVKLLITHSFIKRICVSNACKKEFCIFMSLGD